MIVTNFLTEFYDLLLRKKVLILASCDVDSLATVKILQHLFRVDSVYNTLMSVRDYRDLKNAYSAHADNFTDIILVNCGATHDILNFLEEVPPDARIYIIDHQRPLNVLNIYDTSGRVRLVTFADEEIIPAAEDVFVGNFDDEDQDQDSEDDANLDEPTRYLRQQQKARDAARRKRKKMADQMQLVYDYTQYHYYARPSAFVALHVAMKLGQATPEVVWWAAVGITHCFQMRRMDRAEYCNLVTFVETEVSRVAHRNHNTRFDFKISMVNELDLMLYKHWSVWESCNNTPSWILTFVLWTEAGMRKLKLFFAESGLATERLRLNYPYMPRALKDRLEPSIKKREEKYGLKDWSVGTFLAKYGCTYTFTAMDIQLAAMGILDSGSQSNSLDLVFQDGMECLRKEGVKMITYGISLTQTMLSAINKQVRLLLAMDLVTPYASVLVAKFAEREFNIKYNTSPSYMKLFARFAQEAYAVQHRVRKYRCMPFVLIVPIDHEYVMVIGESPLTHDSPKTQFKRIFELVAKKMDEPDVVGLDCFDPTMCRVKSEYRDEFVEKLNAVLTP